MSSIFKEFNSDAFFTISDASGLSQFTSAKPIAFYSFIWVKKGTVELLIDSQPVTLKANQILALTPIQFLEYKSGKHLVMYQFNRDFYCIKDHDKTVGCAGALFFGNNYIPIITLNSEQQSQFEMLHQVFLDEFKNKDHVQAEMLRMLMTRFIIKCTRLLQQQQEVSIPKSKTELIRRFNVLVESHFKTHHSVSFYANLMHKSPKTLSNSFVKFNSSPLQIIHGRIVLETKRLLNYTDQSAKEIAYSLGFEDPSHLSKLFKKQTGMSPTQFKEQKSSI